LDGVLHKSRVEIARNVGWSWGGLNDFAVVWEIHEMEVDEVEVQETGMNKELDFVDDFVDRYHS
jgi:hypothetical protein